MLNKTKSVGKKVTFPGILSAVFLAYIFFVGAANLPKFLQTILGTYENGGSLRSYIQNTDDQYEALLTSDPEAPAVLDLGSYVNLNGLMARLLGQPMMNERIKLTNGHLSEWQPETADPQQLRTVADNITKLYQKQLQAGKHFLFVMTPTQICKHENLLPAGYTDTSNDTADALLARLEAQGVPCLDLRQSLHDQGMSHEEAFFTTDHHWTPETGFWAYGQILETLAAKQVIPPVESFYTDPENFDFQVYRNCFLGSSGKRTGIYYAGLDDFCVISPKFETNISVNYPSHGTVLEGPFRESVNNPYPESYFTDPDHYNRTLYDLYGRSDTVPVLRENKDAPLDQKLLLIGDSFTNVPFSFLSLYARSSYELDMRHFEEDFGQLYSSYDPDTVILMIHGAGCLDLNASYPFFGE